MDYLWEELANAIVLQSVKDYRNAVRRIRRYGKKKAKKSRATVRECERFFRSGWFRLLTDVDGEELLKDLRSEAA